MWDDLSVTSVLDALHKVLITGEIIHSETSTLDFQMP